MRFLILFALMLVAVPAAAAPTPPPPITPTDGLALFELAKAHAWIPLAALAIGLIVRLLKSDTKIPFTIPSEYRRFAVVVLGVASAALERIIAGTPWKDAALGGTAAVLAAFFGHYFVVDKLRDGKEIAIPGLIIPGAVPSPGAPVTIPPPGPPGPPTIPPGATMMLMVLFVLLLGGCGVFFKALDLAADKARCVVENQDLPNKAIFVKCAIQDPEKYLDLLAESRAATKKALERQAAERGCSPTRVDDGGAP